jgi:hypothetical protein
MSGGIESDLLKITSILFQFTFHTKETLINSTNDVSAIPSSETVSCIRVVCSFESMNIRKVVITSIPFIIILKHHSQYNIQCRLIIPMTSKV